MEASEAARVLGVPTEAPWKDIRRAYRHPIQARHPDRAGAAATAEAVEIIDAYAVLRRAHAEPILAHLGADRSASQAEPTAPSPPAFVPVAWTAIARVDDDTIAFGAPADETFLLLLEAGHDIGEVTYVDRSVPILEVICQFEGTPALSLVITLQGRMDGTEAFCTVESIEARAGPPASEVVDVLVDLLQQRQRSAATKEQ